MNNLYIRVVSGKPFEHPILEENLRQFYPDLDPNNLPNGFEKFIRHPLPQVGIYETFVGTTYRRIDGVFQDVHEIRSLTDDEKAAKIQFMKETFPYKSWSFNEEEGRWEPPVAYPDDGQNYTWDEVVQSWILSS